MARTRMIKPETFDDPDLNALPFEVRWLFVGLWTQADKEGRMEDDPRRLKARLLPFDPALDCDRLLATLAPRFITRYEVGGCKYIQINNFAEHQHPHPRESPSTCPPVPTGEAGKSRDEPCNFTAGSGKAGTSRADSNTESDTDSVCGVDGPGEPPPQIRVKPIAFKRRIDVVWPGRPPVPSALHAEFVSKLGGDAQTAHQRLIDWYPTAAAPYDGKPIGDDDFRFWRARFREWQGTTVKPVDAAQPERLSDEEALAGLIKYQEERAALRRRK